MRDFAGDEFTRQRINRITGIILVSMAVTGFTALFLS